MRGLVFAAMSLRKASFPREVEGLRIGVWLTKHAPTRFSDSRLIQTAFALDVDLIPIFGMVAEVFGSGDGFQACESFF